jgi:hypothetical protein
LRRARIWTQDSLHVQAVEPLVALLGGIARAFLELLQEQDHAHGAEDVGQGLQSSRSDRNRVPEIDLLHGVLSSSQTSGFLTCTCSWLECRAAILKKRSSVVNRAAG